MSGGDVGEGGWGWIGGSGRERGGVGGGREMGRGSDFRMAEPCSLLQAELACFHLMAELCSLQQHVST